MRQPRETIIEAGQTDGYRRKPDDQRAYCLPGHGTWLHNLFHYDFKRFPGVAHIDPLAETRR